MALSKLTTRNAAFSARSVDKDTRTAELTWSTGARVLRQSLSGERFYEELSLSPESVDLTRLASGAPLLNSHRAQDLSDQIGVVEEAWIEEGGARARVRFSSRPEVASIFQDVSDGIIRNVSVGYRILETTREKRDGDDHPTILATRWQPQELSLVSIPADQHSQIRTEEVMEKNEIQNRPEKAKEETKNTNTHTKEDLNQALKSERERVSAITALSQRFQGSAIDPQKMIESGTSIEEARKVILDDLATRSESASVKPSVTVTRDEKATKRERIEKALLSRVALEHQSDDDIREYQGRSVVDLARSFLSLDYHTSRDEVISRAFHSTSDFSKILGNVAKQKLQASYEALSQRQNFWPLAEIVSALTLKT